MIETERLLLRQWAHDDFDALHAILSDPLTMRFWPAPFERSGTAAWMERAMKSYGDNGFGRWCVMLKASGEVIGDCGIARSEVNGVMENDIGYIIHHPWWLHGYATEGAAACRDLALGNLGLDRLVANMAEDNLPSIHVAEKLGMRLERTFCNSRNRGYLTRLYALDRDRKGEEETAG